MAAKPNIKTAEANRVQIRFMRISLQVKHGLNENSFKTKGMMCIIPPLAPVHRAGWCDPFYFCGDPKGLRLLSGNGVEYSDEFMPHTARQAESFK